MKYTLLLLMLLIASKVSAEQNIMHSVYLADKPILYGDDELSMIGEFGLVSADGNTNTSTITAKINTSQELTSWSYQIIGDALYKQSQQEFQGKKNNQASAQKLFLSGQFEFKLTQPDDRLFIYGEYENNRFNGFRYQAALAAGWSSRLWHNKRSQLKYSIGPGYAISEVEENTIDEDNEGLIVRAAIEYKRKFSDNATFRQFLSTEVEQDFSKTKSETSLSTKLTGTLAMKLSFAMNFDTSVRSEIEELDTETTVTLVYRFL